MIVVYKGGCFIRTPFCHKRRAGCFTLSLYSIMAPMRYHVFENIMEKKRFALLEQMLHFP